MLTNSRAVKVQNLRAADLITNNLENRMEDADIFLRSYLALGYTIYDVVAEGGYANLASKTAGKYICLFVNGNPSGGAYTTPSISMHTAVVYTGIRIDSTNTIIKHTMTVILNSLVGSNILSFGFGNFSLGSAQQVKGIQNSVIALTVSAIDLNDLAIISNVYFSGQQINLTMNVGTKVTFLNCKIASDIQTGYSWGAVEFDNCLITGTHSIAGTGAGVIDIRANNFYIDNSASITFTAVTCSTGFNIINAPYNATISGAINALSIVRNNTIYWYNDKSQIVTSYLTSTTNFVTANAHIAHQRKSLRGVLGIIKRNYYNVQFDPLFTITDSLKYNDDSDLILVWRDALETEFTTDLIAKIKNYLFYKSDGTTLVSTYRNGESFLILAQRDSDSSYAVLAWHKGQLWPTIYSEFWKDSLYTIVRCFQIWEHPEEVSLLNLYNITDSPIEATYLMQDATSKVVRV